VTGTPEQLAVTAAAYDAIAVRYAEFVRGELDGLPLDRAVLAAFAEHVRVSGGGLVADVGCGEGRIGAHLAGRRPVRARAGGPIRRGRPDVTRATRRGAVPPRSSADAGRRLRVNGEIPLNRELPHRPHVRNLPHKQCFPVAGRPGRATAAPVSRQRRAGRKGPAVRRAAAARRARAAWEAATSGRRRAPPRRTVAPPRPPASRAASRPAR
jgi:hypothetical protein